jgi:hypothetical protein
MGFIPIFITLGGAIMLFFLTVKKTLQRKVDLQKELVLKIKSQSIELGLAIGDVLEPEELQKLVKSQSPKLPTERTALDLIREMKINRHQYNLLIKKAPYNWIATISGYRPI